MKKLLVVLITILALVIGGIFMFRHFVTNRVMDKGGMENPEYTDDEEDIQELDGDQTYVDNDALLSMLIGTWKSTDERYTLTVYEDYRITLMQENEVVLESPVDFTYLLPGEPEETELTLTSTELKNQDGAVLGEVESFYFIPADENQLCITLEDDEEIIMKRGEE